MKLFNVADKVFKDSPFYFLSKDSKLFDEASKLDFSFEVLDSEIGLRKIKFDVEHLATFLTYIMKYTSVLYCKDLTLLPELVGDKIKATKVESIKPLFGTIRTRYVDYSSNFYRFYHLLGDYKKKVELLVKLTKDKQKLDSLTKRG